MRKYSVSVDFGQQGYSAYVNIFQLWKILRRDTKEAGIVTVRFFK